jgi:hypothetical protein
LDRVQEQVKIMVCKDSMGHAIRGSCGGS